MLDLIIDLLDTNNKYKSTLRILLGVDFLILMKKIVYILLLLVSVVSCKTSQKIKSENPNYKPLEYFGTDTLAFYKYNFEEHKDFYIGKKFSVLINDMGYKSTAVPNHIYSKEYSEDMIKSTRIFLEPFGVALFSLKDFTEFVTVSFDEGSYLKSKDYYDYKHKIEKEVAKEKGVELPSNEDGKYYVPSDEVFYREKYFLSDCIIKDMKVFRFEVKRPKNRR